MSNCALPEIDEALSFAWGRYRVWAATARRAKAEQERWRAIVFALVLSGVVLATLCHQLGAAGLPHWVPAVLGWLSAACLGFGAYFSKEILGPERESASIRARSLAESLKAETYLYRMRVEPYDRESRAASLLQTVKEREGAGEDLVRVELEEAPKREGLTREPTGVEQYIARRVRKQIDDFYRPRAQDHRRVVDRTRLWQLGLGAVAVALGALGGTLTWYAAGWVAVCGTIGTALAGRLYAGRHRYLVTSYLSTALRLENLEAEWKASGKQDRDKHARDRFVKACEDAISIENRAWMAKYVERRNEGHAGRETAY